LSLQDRSGALLYGHKAVLDDHPVVDRVAMPDGDWKLAAAPAGGWSTAIAKPLFHFRAITLAIVLLLLALLYFLLSYRSLLNIAVRQRTADLQRPCDHGKRRTAQPAACSSAAGHGGHLGPCPAVEMKSDDSGITSCRDQARMIATEMASPTMPSTASGGGVFTTSGKVALPEQSWEAGGLDRRGIRPGEVPRP
jgi:hypothetical protein